MRGHACMHVQIHAIIYYHKFGCACIQLMLKVLANKRRVWQYPYWLVLWRIYSYLLMGSYLFSLFLFANTLVNLISLNLLLHIFHVGSGKSVEKYLTFEVHGFGGLGISGFLLWCHEGKHACMFLHACTIYNNNDINPTATHLFQSKITCSNSLSVPKLRVKCVHQREIIFPQKAVSANWSLIAVCFLCNY